MLRFFGGFVLVMGAMLTCAIVGDGLGRRLDTAYVVGAMLGGPALACWLALEGVRRWRPRRWMDGRVRRGAMLAASGVGAGVVAAVASTAWIVLMDRVNGSAMWQAAGLAGAAGLASGAVLLALPRRRAGCCVHCEYDLSSSPGRCPECGAAGSRGGAPAPASPVGSAGEHGQPAQPAQAHGLA